MPIQGESRLQVITATTLLTEPIPPQPPILITQIDSIETASELISTLQAEFASKHPVSLLEELTAAQPRSTETNLGQVELQSWVYPVSLFLPASASPTLVAVQQLVDVVATLRSPDGGCPWDLAQTAKSLTPYVIEEAYEVVDAIQNRDMAAVTEELGDLLLQVVLQAQIASEQNAFTLTEIAQGITEKLIRRHPHVFGEVQAQTIDQVHRNWEEIKAAENESQTLSQKLSHYARSLPPLTAGMKISRKAATAGLEWQNISGVWAKFYEELAEFQEALLQGNSGHQQSELGDLLFTVINLARWCQLDPTEALQETNQRFIQRLAQVEATINQPLSNYTLGELERLWQQAKDQLEQSS